MCRIAARPQSAKAMNWRQTRGSSGSASEPFSSVEATPEAGQLRERIVELEQRLKSEGGQSREAAYEEGLRRGREESAGDVKAASDRLAQTLADLVSFKRKIRVDAEMELVNLSLAIARRILHRELHVDPEAMHGLVHAALQKMQAREIYRVRVSAAGAEGVRSALERMGAGAIEIVVDSSLKSGDLVMETAIGELDASIDTQLQEIQRGFADRLALR